MLYVIFWPEMVLAYDAGISGFPLITPYRYQPLFLHFSVFREPMTASVVTKRNATTRLRH